MKTVLKIVWWLWGGGGAKMRGGRIFYRIEKNFSFYSFCLLLFDQISRKWRRLAQQF